MTTINSSNPLESLIQAFQSLNWDEQKELLEILEDKIFETEEAWENSAEILSEVQKAKQAY